MTVKVKICGITSIDDALLATELGADMIGLNFYPNSSRYLTVNEAADIVAKIPKSVLKVGVFVNSTAEEISEIAKKAMLDVIQLHGDEDNDFIRTVSFETEKPIIKAFRIKDESSFGNVLHTDAEAVLLDSAGKNGFGGTGETFDWSWIAGVSCNRQLFLAGGLTAENVADAVRLVRPYAVDVASGVESEPGIKDPKKVKAFIENAKSA